MVKLGVGQSFAEFTLDGVLGRGGTGLVYLARHPRMPGQVALKLLANEVSADPRLRSRFEQEANAIARLNHPGIVGLHDRGMHNDQLWIAMQYIRGTDAAQLMPQEVSPHRAVRIITETAAALDFAHSRGVLHRDVKPANILLATPEPGHEERAVLTDFGIARLVDSNLQLTSTGTFTATMAFASPEQLTGAPVDHRADQYALGCTLFTLLTGRPPFVSENPGEVAAGHLNRSMPRLSVFRRDTPPQLDRVLARATAKRREDRYPTCTEFAVAAAEALAGQAAAREPHPLAEQVGTRAGGAAPSPGAAPTGAAVPGRDSAPTGEATPGRGPAPAGDVRSASRDAVRQGFSYASPSAQHSADHRGADATSQQGTILGKLTGGLLLAGAMLGIGASILPIVSVWLPPFGLQRWYAWQVETESMSGRTGSATHLLAVAFVMSIVLAGASGVLLLRNTSRAWVRPFAALAAGLNFGVNLAAIIDMAEYQSQAYTDFVLGAGGWFLVGAATLALAALALSLAEAALSTPQPSPASPAGRSNRTTGALLTAAALLTAVTPFLGRENRGDAGYFAFFGVAPHTLFQSPDIALLLVALPAAAIGILLTVTPGPAHRHGMLLSTGALIGVTATAVLEASSELVGSWRFIEVFVLGEWLLTAATLLASLAVVASSSKKPNVAKR
ncbi:serine/threonine-protein kinase [Nocardia sp. NPDC005978]|uniref:serine/threonine-protein kinase n=1 Tax=Nocardia sp. NPDC005978 TaxID=3156725 RepID=UPI0033B9F8E2